MTAHTERRERPRRLSLGDRREQILQGAMRVFAQRGYEGASMTQIAQAGGVTAAVIYDHFASKQQLHALLLEGQTEALLMYVGRALADTDPNPAARMRTGVDAFFEFVEDHPFAWRLIFRDPPADPEIALAHTRIHQRATEGIALFLEHSAPGALREDPHRQQTLQMYAELLKMSLNGMAAWWYEHPTAKREELVQRVLDFCWSGLSSQLDEPHRSERA
jgi:AcrR family transcriptional regulator